MNNILQRWIKKKLMFNVGLVVLDKLNFMGANAWRTADYVYNKST